MIVLKWLLAMLLTSVPFVFHYCIKPKAASSDKWRNFYSFLSARMPWLKRKALAVKAWISYIYHKMYRSDKGRKFFTLVLVICMLVFQVVDFHAAKEACSFQVEWAAKGKALSLTPYDIGLPGIDGEVELGPKSFMENILYPFQTSFLEDGYDGSISYSASVRCPAISGKLLLSKARFPGALAPETVLFYNRGEPNPRFHG